MIYQAAMISAFVCPNCNQPVISESQVCTSCGTDLAFFNLEESKTETTPKGKREELVYSPEMLVPRLGDYLVKKGEITAGQLDRALKFQVENGTQGHPILIGRALVELGYISREILDQAVTVQILQLQEALRNSNQQLEQRVQERTQDLSKALERVNELSQIKANFIANVSHELRTPLTMLKGYLDMMADGAFGKVTGEQTEAIDALMRAETRLENLIEDLILFAYSERGELSLNLEPANLDEMIRGTVRSSMYKARASGVSLETKIPTQVPEVRCDREKINWVIGELLTNAIKFTPRGGRVLIGAQPVDNAVTVSVTDTGIGIPEERKLEIFEPFHQLDGSPTRKYGGTGLGLALSNRIIEAHGSHVNVLSKPGHGSRFEFSLPIAS